MSDKLMYPPTIVFGTKPPDIRLKQSEGSQVYFCRNNMNLHLAERDFHEGTFEMGNLLGRLCRQYCAPHRHAARNHQPCPAFVKSWQVGTENKGLASVEMHPVPKWELCRGFERLAATTQTEEERYFLHAYLGDKYADESSWRDYLVKQWNAYWHLVPEGWSEHGRRAKFDQMLWWTIRFPALIPQVWLNWLANAAESEMKLLDENPSRVDFLAFWHDERYVIEIDGPSHYADWNGESYRVDERAYARNLKIERSLRRHGWNVARVGRIEVRDVMEDESTAFFGAMALLKVLAFYPKVGYPEELPAEYLGVPEIDRSLPRQEAHASLVGDDDIPF
jgi:hypothetical protein